MIEQTQEYSVTIKSFHRMVTSEKDRQFWLGIKFLEENSVQFDISLLHDYSYQKKINFNSEEDMNYFLLCNSDNFKRVIV